MATAESEASAFQRIIVAAVVLAVGVTIVSQVVSVSGLVSVDGSVRVPNDDVVALGDVDQVTEVRDSTGRAAELNGGEVAVSGGLGAVSDSDDRWTFATYTSVEDSSRASVLWSLDNNWLITYVPDNGGQYAVWYYNESSTNAYTVSVAAGAPTTLSPVLVERDGNTITVFNESGASNSVTLSPSGDTSAAIPTSNSLNGRLDETRVWDRPLNASERSAYRSDGIQPIAVGNRSSRLLFDQGADDVAVEFRGSQGELRGAAGRGSGLAGTTLTGGTDYEVREVNGETSLVVLSGGALENQPRVAIDTPRAPLEQAVLAIGSALGLAGVVIIVVVASRILGVVKRT